MICSRILHGPSYRISATVIRPGLPIASEVLNKEELFYHSVTGIPVLGRAVVSRRAGLTGRDRLTPLMADDVLMKDCGCLHGLTGTCSGFSVKNTCWNTKNGDPRL